MRTTKTILVCDYCGRGLDTNPETIDLKAAPGEGFSAIRFKGREFPVGGQTYCNLVCLMKDIAKELDRDNFARAIEVLKC